MTAPFVAPAGREAIVWALLALVLYTANFRLIASGDSYAARFVPFAVLGYGTVLLDPVEALVRNEHPNPYWMQTTRDGRHASLFPIATPLVVTPLYLPAAAYLWATDWSPARVAPLARIMEKIAASVVAASAVGLMFVLLARSTVRRDARWLTVAFAAGTSTWVIGSQALWMHGVAELLLLAGLVALTGGESRTRLIVAGTAAGLLAMNRPLDALFAAALACYVWRTCRSGLAAFAAAAAVPVAALLVYNMTVFGVPWGGYQATGHISRVFFGHPVFEGIAGLLVSPGKGLLVYSPFLLWLGYRNSLSAHPFSGLARLLAAAVALQVVMYAATDWRAGYAYGTRFLLTTVPVLVWLLVVPLQRLSASGRRWFAAAVAVAIAIQAIGAFKYDWHSDILLDAPDQRWMFERTWDVAFSPPLVELRQPWAPRTVLDDLHRLAEADIR